MKITWIKRYFLITSIIIFICGCQYNRKDGVQLPNQYEDVRITIDDEVISSGDTFQVIEPLWWSVSIYDGEEKYEEDLEKFTKAQRYIFAIEWYLAEVNNGGHYQFYDNSTGIVWEDALYGLKAIGAEEHYKILEESAKRMGGTPSKDRETRWSQIEENNPDFDKLDTRFYELDKELQEKEQAYIKDNASEFYFDGIVKMPK